jgi:hypothetical protein
MNEFALIESFVNELWENGTAGRWNREKAGRKPGPGLRRYDRSAVMRSAWEYRKRDGHTMSVALQLAWSDARRTKLRLVA